MASKKKSRASKKVPAAIRKNLIGDVYGRLKVIAFGGYRDTAIMWQCKCECGSVSDYYRANLRSGTSTQCLKCNHQALQSLSTSHGMNRTPIYRTWERVRRTEELSKRWLKFQNFYDDVGDKPSADHFFVRKDASKKWTKANSAWVHKKDVKKTGGASHLLTYKRRTQSITEWAAEIGITAASLRGRLDRGWSMKKAVETPKFKPKKKVRKKKVRKKKAVKKKTLKKKAPKKTALKKKTLKKKVRKKAAVKKKVATKRKASARKKPVKRVSKKKR